MAPIRPQLREAGFTDQQWRVLRVLADEGTLDATEVAKLSLLYAPTVTRILKELTERGYLSRATDPGDRRRTIVSITQAGNDIFRRTAEQTAIILRRYEAAFGAERLTKLVEDLSDLAETLAPFAPRDTADDTNDRPA